MLNRLVRCALTFLVLSVGCFQAGAHLPEDRLLVRYPLVDDQHPREFDDYFLKLLKLGLEKSGKPYELIPVNTPMLVEDRSSRNLQKNYYDLHWLNTSPERETKLLPVRISLLKDLAGWRLLFIRPESAKAFKEVSQLEDLHRFVAGQGHDWPDTRIFRHNKLPLKTSASWEGLFKMLHQKRIDYFPRSVFEIWREQALFSHFDFEIESRLMLRYPAAYYFFIGKDNPEIALTLEKGLLIAIEDGSFDAVFYEHFGEIIKRAAIDERIIIELENPVYGRSAPNQR